MRRLHLMVALALSLPLAACSDSTAPASSVEGVYALELIGGAPLPWLAMEYEADKVEVVGGEIALSGDGTFTDRMIFRVTEGGVERMENDLFEGTFEANGHGALLSPTGFQPYEVSISDETLILMIQTIELLYRK